MVKLFLYLYLVLSCQVIFAQPFEARLDDEIFIQKHSAKTPKNDKIIEFVKNSESLENWTKLIAYRYQQLPGADNDPSKVALGMASVLRAQGMMSAVAENKKNSEAMIDFITRGSSNVLEFNVFRYMKSKDSNAVISLQFAYRFTDTSEQNVQKILNLRESWTKQAIGFDMKIVEESLAKIN